VHEPVASVGGAVADLAGDPYLERLVLRPGLERVKFLLDLVRLAPEDPGELPLAVLVEV